MAKMTIRKVRDILGIVFPEVVFTYGTDGRGRNRGHCVSWTGGPSAFDVRLHVMSYPSTLHFDRQMTEEELAAYLAEADAREAERKAAEPARKAAAKAAGIAKRAATVAAKKDRQAKLAAAFPGVDFTFSHAGVTWTDGPDVASVCRVLSLQTWQCHHTVSAEAARAGQEAAKATMRANRLARRPEVSKARALRVSKAIARLARLAARAQAQLCLPLFV